MNVRVIVGREDIRRALKELRAASEPGRSNDGVRLVVQYKAFGIPTPRALAEVALAKSEGWALDTFSGTLDRVFENKAGELCFSIRCLERQTFDGRHCFRTFNTAKGKVLQIVVLGNGNGHSHDMNEPGAQEAQ